MAKVLATYGVLGQTLREKLGMIARCLIAALAAVICTCAMVQRVADAQVADAAMGTVLAKIGNKTVARS
jgi:hypothetical protein